MRLLVGLLGGLTLLAFLGRYWWPLELASFFRPLEAALLLALALAGLAIRLPATAAAAALLALVGAAAVLAATWERPRYATPEGRPAELLLINVWERNDDYGQVAALVERELPDVVGLSELTPEWARALEPALARYATRATAPRPGSEGIGLYGRQGLSGPRIRTFAPGAAPAAVGFVRVGSRRLTLVLIHPPFPVTPENARRRSAQLAALADEIRAGRLGPRVAVCGDLNAPPWSASARRLARQAGLTDTSRGYRLQGTWPSFLPGPLRIPLDGCFVSAGVALVSRTARPGVGSDHLPLVVELAAAS